MHIRDLVKRSLTAISNLNYPDYELVIVDNGSTDGSYEYVREVARELPIDIKLVRLEHNLGFTGGNNIGYIKASSDSEYIALINNDAIPTPDSLGKLISPMIQETKIAGTQGVIAKLNNSKLVDTAGGLINELLIPILLYSNMHVDVALKNLPRYISYPDGAYSVIKRSAIEECLGEVPFIWKGFMYFDDMYLGLGLWDCGYRVVSLPILAGFHSRGSTSKGSRLTIYYGVRGWVALNYISNSRYRRLINIAVALRSIKGAGSASYFRGLMDGIKLGETILRRYSRTIDIYRAPIEKIPLHKAISSLILLRLSI